jgi:hypothetical protein
MREHCGLLDAGVEASGPHDFAVRFPVHSSRAPQASTASRPTFLTMANAPLPGRDGRACNGDLPDMLSEIFSAKGLDTISSDLPVGQITWMNSQDRKPIDR